MVQVLARLREAQVPSHLTFIEAVAQYPAIEWPKLACFPRQRKSLQL